MTPAQAKFIELEAKKDEVKRFFDELQAATEAVAQEVGIGGFFQDPNSGLVYQIVIPEGRFVHYEKIGYVRTKRDGERAGTLSVKAAEAAGFTVK